MWVLNEETLQPEKDTLPIIIPGLDSLYEVKSTFPEMQVHFKVDGDYYLRWETLPENQDQARNPPLPEPTMLSVYKITSEPPTKIRPEIPSNKKTYRPIVQGSTISFHFLENNSSVALYSIEGKKIVASKQTTMVQEFSNLARGTYFYQIKNHETKNSVIHKIIVR